MDHKAAIETITEIERRFDVNSLCYENLRVWPLIRLELWGQLLHNNEGAKIEARASKPILIARFVKTSISISKKMLTLPKNYWLFHRQLNHLRHKGYFEVLFFSRQQEHREIVDGKSYNPILDPLIELLEDQYRCLKIGIGTPPSDFILPYSKGVVFINQPYWHLHNLLERFWFWNGSHKSVIQGFNEFQKAALSVTGQVRLSQDYLLHQIWKLKLYRRFFGQVLSVIHPRVVFLSCYYYIAAMALVNACKEAGITTVDVQHGKQGKYHALYTHWTQVPEEGYELVPDYFWVWGIETKQNILSRMPKKSPHRPVVGGNRWLSKWINESGSVTKSVPQDFLKRLKSYKRVILVSLQPVSEPLSETLLDAIRLSPKSWIWLLRLHPLMKEREKEVASTVSDLKDAVASVEIENASSLSLYLLLKLVDYHVTGWSTVCYEALVFRVHTVIISPVGKELYKDYIYQELFSYAETGAALVDIIKKDRDVFKYEEEQPYIETSDLVASQALRVIMSDRKQHSLKLA